MASHRYYILQGNDPSRMLRMLFPILDVRGRKQNADYFALSVMPIVWERIGEAAWPIPHNYWEQEQKRRANMFALRQKDAEANSIYTVSWYFD